MPEKHIVTGVGGAVVGILAGVALGGSGTENKINTGMKRAFEPVQEVTASLNDRIGALEEAAATNATALNETMAANNEALTARMDDIEAMLGSLEGGLSDKLSAATAEQTAALQAGFADLKAGTGAGAAREAAGNDTEEAAGGEGASGASAVSEGLTAGQTAIFGDTRVFVSLADEAAGTARLAVNGALATLAVGESHDTGADCSVTLDGVAEGAVSVSSDCGGSGTAAAAPSDDGDPVDGASPGETVVLADGALRVFVSSVLGAEGARLAINGVETVTVGAGESVEIQAGDQTCTVTVAATGGGQAAVDGSCS